jgi:hypothetical protein
MLNYVSEIHPLVLKCQIETMFECSVSLNNTNTISIVLHENKVNFKFRTVKGTQLKCFTICTIENPLFNGVLFVQDFRSGDIEAYNENFLENVRTRLGEIRDIGIETYISSVSPPSRKKRHLV